MQKIQMVPINGIACCIQNIFRIQTIPYTNDFIPYAKKYK
jgi:hypothetical protein